jgi:Transposase DDE domain
LANTLDESWQVLLDMLPSGWQEQAVLSGAVERLRGFRSAGDLLRVLLMHVARDYSLRETAVRARQAGLSKTSAVALFKRLRGADEWWRRLCTGLLQERGWGMTADPRGYRVRAVDSTLVTEPGPKGKAWRVHYSLELPNLECDQLEVTSMAGPGTGEKLSRFRAAPGDLVLADRGFCKPGEVINCSKQGAAIVVRLNTTSLPLWQPGDGAFALLERLRTVVEPGIAMEWAVQVRSASDRLTGRLCVIRKSEEATERARRRIRNKSRLAGSTPKPETFEYAAYVMVFTTLPSDRFPTTDVLEFYRLRWQIELHFKRLKTLGGLGHLLKHDARSARAWLYGKLLVALLGDKLARVAGDISPWGYILRPNHQ